MFSNFFSIGVSDVWEGRVAIHNLLPGTKYEAKVIILHYEQIVTYKVFLRGASCIQKKTIYVQF